MRMRLSIRRLELFTSVLNYAESRLLGLAVAAGVLCLASAGAQAAVVTEGAIYPNANDSFWTTGGSEFYPAIIGDGGDGSVSMDGGSTLVNIQTRVGNTVGHHGELELTGSGTTWTTNGEQYFGYSGSAEVSITDGAQVSGGATTVANNSQSTATVLVRGSGSQLSASSLVVGNNGTGTLNVTDGGKVVTSGDFTVQGGTGTGTVNLGISSNAVLAQIGGTLTNNGTINAYALGNLAAGNITLATASGLTGDGDLNGWGGSLADNSAIFTVSEYTAYVGPITGTNLNAARVNIDDGDLIVSFADNAGTGDFSVSEVVVPEPSGYDYFEAAQIDMTGLTNSSVILSVLMDQNINPETITAWMLVAGEWEAIDEDSTLTTYEQDYYSFLVDEGGVYAVTGNAVPEPGHYAALIGLLVLAGVVIRRRRR